MTARARPTTVTAVLVLLILIAIYQLLGSLAAFTGAAAMETVDAVAANASVPTWAVLTAAAIGLVYGTAAIVAAVMLYRDRPGARRTVTWVNGVYAVVIAALLSTPVSGVPEIIAAAVALTVIGLANSESARGYFSGALRSGHARAQAG
ncbi:MULTISPECIES: hypothetical protein [unclassified Nocardiopsis]|uniref:hypothetical protein n=1 Tax=unclassified Nocardiopsis TaxID=2649073 RepID=UPI00135C4066|nr:MULTISPECIES: hypothetical protein [unclassified Nocardiopsis]